MTITQMAIQPGTVIAFSQLQTMEPIILLPTPSQNTTAAKAPETAAPAEGAFQSLLDACQSLAKGDEASQDSIPADPMILSLLLSMLQSPLDPSSVVSPEVLGGEPENTSAPALGLSNPVDPPIIEYLPKLAQVSEKDLLFSGEVVNRNERGWSPVVNTQTVVNPQGVNPQEETAGAAVVPSTLSAPEVLPDPLPPMQDSLSPLPTSFSDQIKDAVTAGTQPQEFWKPVTPPRVNTAYAESGAKSTGLIDPANTPPIKKETDPVGQEKLKELFNPTVRVNKGPVDPLNPEVKNVVVNRPDEIMKQDSPRDPASQPGTLTSKPLQENSPQGEAVSWSSQGKEAIPPLFEEITGLEKTSVEAIEKDGNIPSLKKEIENRGEISLISKPEGNQAASSANEVTKTHEPAALRTETPEILQQISKKLIWSIRNGEEKIKLQLEPPQLGSLHIEIGRQKDMLQATVWTTNQMTKELLESHQVELQRILKEDGFHLGQFDVFVNPHMKSFEERMEGHAGQTGQGFRNHASHEPRGSLSRSESEGAPLPITSWMRGSNRIDFFI